MMRVLVTGSSGFIGRHLCAALQARGDVVVGLDARTGVDLLDSGTLIQEQGQRANEATYEEGWSGRAGWAECYDGVVHLAAINGTRNFYERPADVLRVGIAGTMNVVDWWTGGNKGAANDRPKFFVFASSSEVYHDPSVIPTPEDVPLVVPDIANPRFSYSVSKIAGEAMVHHWLKDFPRAMIVRLHNVYGPGMSEDHVIGRIAAQLRNWENHDTLVLKGDGDAERAFCHVADAVTGILAVVDRGEHLGTYNVGDDSGYTTIAGLAWTMLNLVGLGGITPRFEDATPAGSPSARCPDTSRLRALGWAPKVCLQDGLREMVA